MAPLDIPDDDSEASDDDELPIPEEEDDLCPTIVLTREEKARLRKPWKQALIIKLLGRSIELSLYEIEAVMGAQRSIFSDRHRQ